MSPLKASLSLTQEEMRRAARVDLLAAQGEAGVPELLRMLEDPSWTVRRNVVASLASLGELAVAPLCVLLKTRRDNETRIAATVDTLVASTGNVETALASLIASEDPAVVADSAQILGRRKNPASVPVLRELTQHADDNVSVMAIEGLGRVGGRSAVDSLVQLIDEGNFFRTFPAIDVLGRSGDPRAVPPLVSLLNNPLYQMEAARALGRTGDTQAVAPLAALLLHPGESAVRAAIVALADLHARYAAQYGLGAPFDEALQRAVPATKVIRRLMEVFDGAAVEEQRAICFLLGRCGADEAVQPLTSLLDESQPVADEAARALEHLGVASDQRLLTALIEGDSARRLVLLPLVKRSSALEEVRSCLADPEPDVRVLACRTLARLGQLKVVSSLFLLLADSDPRVVHAATAAIQSLGGAETEKLALEAARSGAPGVQRAAVRILSYFGYAAALPCLIEALGHEDAQVREQAIQGLAFVDDPHALETLLQTLRDPNERMRAQAARALGQSAAEDPRVDANLIRALEDSDAWVRYYALQSLGRRACEPATGVIARRLQDDAGQVRVAAVEALSHFTGEEALAELRNAASSQDPDVERAALVGLGIGRDLSSLPTLLRAASSPDASTRLVALSAVSNFPGPEVLAVLRRAATDADESVRNTAVGFLANYPSVEATSILIELLRATPPSSRVQAALSTYTTGRVGGIERALATADDEEALHLTAALTRLRHREAIDALIHGLSLTNVAARKAAATALSAVRTADAREALKRAAREDVNAEVRRICALVVVQ